MALTHNFFSIKEEDIHNIVEDYQKGNFRDLIETQDKVSIHDNVIQFINKTLNWVSTKNYKNIEDHKGLFYHGITIIHPDQITVFRKIISQWIVLFEYAPNVFYLNQIENGVEMKKEEVRVKLDMLNNFLSKILENGNYLIHHGI